MGDRGVDGEVRGAGEVLNMIGWIYLFKVCAYG